MTRAELRQILVEEMTCGPLKTLLDRLESRIMEALAR